MNPLPPDWATLQQPAPSNHGTPAIDALRPGQPLREVVGDFLADAAIARAEVGERTYGSKLTPNNGRDQAIDALQELADAAAYLAAWHAEAPSNVDTVMGDHIEAAMSSIQDAAYWIAAARKAEPTSRKFAAAEAAKGEKP